MSPHCPKGFNASSLIILDLKEALLFSGVNAWIDQSVVGTQIPFNNNQLEWIGTQLPQILL